MIESLRIFGEKNQHKKKWVVKTLKQKSSTSVVGDRKDRFFWERHLADFGGFLGIFEFLILWAVKKNP